MRPSAGAVIRDCEVRTTDKCLFVMHHKQQKCLRNSQMKLSHIKTIASEIERIINEYISGEMSEKRFFKEYPSVLDQFEEELEDGPYILLIF